jgi:hypothetical protein
MAAKVEQFLMQHGPELWPQVESVKLLALGKAAFVLSQTRLWYFARFGMSQQVDVPLVDMLNHASHSPNTAVSHVTCDSLGLPALGLADGSTLCREVKARYAIAVGDELFISYNSIYYAGNTQWVNEYGFLEMAHAGVSPNPMRLTLFDMNVNSSGSVPHIDDDYMLVWKAFFKFPPTPVPAVYIDHVLGTGPLGRLRHDTLQALRAADIMRDPTAVRGFAAALRSGALKRAPDTAAPVSLRNEWGALRLLVRMLYRGDETALIARDRELLAAAHSPLLPADVRLAIELRLSLRLGNQEVPQLALEAWRALLMQEAWADNGGWSDASRTSALESLRAVDGWEGWAY